ncbi:MAG: hypothetical protein ACFFCS_27500 [Candidatus Hodarchaeota archaeon]
MVKKNQEIERAYEIGYDDGQRDLLEEIDCNEDTCPFIELIALFNILLPNGECDFQVNGKCNHYGALKRLKKVNKKHE